MSTDQRRATLRQNELLAGHDEAVDQLLGVGKVVTFRGKQRLTEQGGQDDDVFFLLRGAVDVHVGSRRCDGREAPQVVGELAAASPGKPRTATVTAGPNGATVLRVQGQAFRDVLDAHPEVRRRHGDRVDEIMRQNTALAGQSLKSEGPVWWVVSASIGASGAIVAGIYTWSVGWGWSDVLLSAVAGGTALFILAMLLSVKRIIFTTMMTAAAAIIGIFAPWSLSGSASIASESASWLDVSLAWGHQGDPGEKVIAVLALLALVGILGAFYRMLPD